MTLNTVDLPAPFGPIRASVSPGSTEKETPSSALLPPKESVMSSMTSMLI